MRDRTMDLVIGGVAFLIAMLLAWAAHAAKPRPEVCYRTVLSRSPLMSQTVVQCFRDRKLVKTYLETETREVAR